MRGIGGAGYEAVPHRSVPILVGAVALGRRNSSARDVGVFPSRSEFRDGRVRLFGHHRTAVPDG